MVAALCAQCGKDGGNSVQAMWLHGGGMDDRWLSVDEIAEYLGVARDTVYTWVTSKGMPGHKVGRFWKFKKQDVDAWVREGGAAASSDDFENRESSSG
jgi:excisionase family DNA binding protein